MGAWDLKPWLKRNRHTHISWLYYVSATSLPGASPGEYGLIGIYRLIIGKRQCPVRIECVPDNIRRGDPNH